MKYSVGLDIGNSSVGWAVINPKTYQILRAKGKNAIGVRLFDSAQTAEERRGYRTTRRRLSRRRWRLRLLNEIFATELAKVDENFLPRLKYSWVNPKDASNPQFNGEDANGAIFGTVALDKTFYQKYPTIYHLRAELINNPAKADLREVYLAIHHIVKYRGHFLNSAEKIDTNQTFDVASLQTALVNYAEHLDDPTEFLSISDENQFAEAIQNQLLRKKERQEKATTFVEGNTKMISQLTGALLGYTVNLEVLFSLTDIDKEDKNKYKVQFDDEELDDKLSEATALSEEQLELIAVLRRAYAGLQLKQILGDKQSISEAMIARYQAHAEQLKWLKKHRINKDKHFDENYQNWLAEKDVDNVTKYFKKIIEATDASDKEQYLQLIEEGEFLPTQRNKSNGNIPHQIHGNELTQIIENQSKYYPFLLDTFKKDDKDANKIVALLKFRVPYYVGPLATAESTGNNQNHWLVKRAGQENTIISPWNLDQVVDKDKSGEQFIKRMTGTDTYLLGEPALAVNTPTYQTYNVLQELNNVRVDGQRLDVKTKQKMFNALFKKTKTVSAKAAQDWLAGEYGKSVLLTGLADPKKFNSALTSYHDLKKVFGEQIELLWTNQIELLDNIVEVQTVFEDGAVALRRLQKLLPTELQPFAPALSEKHYTGWGRLSAKLLRTKVVDNLRSLPGTTTFTDGQTVASILDVLWHSSVNLMELVGNVNDTYGVVAWINEQNIDDDNQKDIYALIEDLAGPKDIKRGITQAFKILDDLKRAFGQEPENVYLEFARESQPTSLSNSRLNRVQELYKSLTKTDKLIDLEKAISAETKEKLQDDRLYLYYIQQGKDMYTGDALDIENLSQYDIDHIVPQAMVKDNSLDNRVLVSLRANRLKNDSEVLPADIRTKMTPFWQRLHAQGFISKRKLDNLTRRSISDVQKERFIARSLVETRQIIKNVATLIDNHFEQTKAVAVRSSLTSDMRQYVKVAKNRDINDYHHAHDALLVATVGQYIQNKGFFVKGQLSDNLGNEYNRYAKRKLQDARESAGQSDRINPFSMVVGSMAAATERKAGLMPSVNMATGEIVWTPDNKQYLLKVLDYSKLLVTKRTKVQSGQLYDETLYPSKKNDPKSKAKIPLNHRKNPKLVYGDTEGQLEYHDTNAIDLYGGFNSAKPAYTALVAIGKPGNYKYKLVNVLRQWVNEARQSDDFLMDKIRQTYPDAQLILNKVLYGQVATNKGQLVTVSSATELHNFNQLYLNQSDYNQTTKLLKLKANLADDVDHQNMNDMIRKIVELASKRFTLYATLFKQMSDNFDDNFDTLDFEDKQQLLQRLLTALHANPSTADFKKMKVSNKGRQFYPSGVAFGENDIFIFQSPTGLFERRLTIKELAQRAGIE